MTTLNINAFKIVFPDGRENFELTICDNGSGLSCDSIRWLAIHIKDEVKSFLCNNQPGRATIDLFPYHDIDCPNGLVPRRCLPLNEAEANEFWEHFNKLAL